MEKKKRFLIKPPYIAVLCILLAWLLNKWLPEFKAIGAPYNKIGTLIIILGFSTLLASSYLFKKNKTPVIPREKPKFMIAEGAYKFSRNPIYLSVTIILTGIAFYIGNILSFVAPLFFFMFVNCVFVPFEEKMLEDIFGKKYLNYKKKVRRWL